MFKRGAEALAEGTEEDVALVRCIVSFLDTFSLILPPACFGTFDSTCKMHACNLNFMTSLAKRKVM